MTTSLRSLLVLLLYFITNTHAVQDANAPWGDYPPRQFQNYWREPGNLLQDLEQFSALYISTEGCLWSEYGYAAYDDDGENRDGDEQWYQGRTTAFRANAAYNVYGIRKGPFHWSLQNCGRHSYINTFITNNGADAILNVTGRLKSTDDFDSGYGHSYCYPVNNDDNGRELGSGNNNNNDGMSTTMGCSLEGNDYAMAVFQGDYCDGKYFMDITDEMKDYNKQMRRVKCVKIWDYSWAFQHGVRVDTPADYLLQESSSCSNTMYDGKCPDPYGVNKAYHRAVSKRGPVSQTFVKVTSWMAFLVGLVLMSAAYYAKHRRRLRKLNSQFWSKRKRRRRQQRMDEEDPATLPSVELSRTSSQRPTEIIPENTVPMRKKRSKSRKERDGSMPSEKKRSKSRRQEGVVSLDKQNKSKSGKLRTRSKDRPHVKEENTIV